MQQFSLVYNNLFVFLEPVDEPWPTCDCGQLMKGSGILPVNAHAEVNILNLNYITALYFILLSLYCQIICTTINNRGASCNICFKALCFHNLTVLSAVFSANRKYQ